MRLIFVSNQFPPDSRGGYENLCKEVATAFVQRGHEVTVITSRFGNATGNTDDTPFSVHRVLRRELEGRLKDTVIKLLSDRSASEAQNLAHIQQLVAEIQPDAVLIWGMWNMPRSVPAEFERLMPNRVAYYLCDYWPSLPSAYIQRWEEPARWQMAQIGKNLLGSYFLQILRREPVIALQFRKVFTVSKAVREILVAKNVPIPHAQVVYGGTKLDEYLRAGTERTELPEKLRLVWIGRLEADKGLHTAIDAIAMVRSVSGVEISLNVYGQGNPDYTQRVKAAVAEKKLGDIVTFCGVVPHSEIPDVLAQHDVLLFTSEWEEPFARSPLEALLVGLSVISTTTGGSGEALIEGKTALTYPAGNAQALARQIERMASDPSLRSNLAMAGRKMVIEEFSFERTVDELEASMDTLCEESVQNATLFESHHNKNDRQLAEEIIH